MVVVSGISVVLLLSLIAFYKKIFNRYISFKYLLVLISLLPLVSLLRQGGYESGDLNLHVAVAIPFFESLKQGNIFPIWNPYVLSGYGYPLYLFIYPLPYYLASFIHFTGISLIDSFKVVAGISYVLSGLFMFLFIKKITKKELAGLVAALFYLFAPYHLVDLHFRFTIGEVIAFFFLPATFYFAELVHDRKKMGFFLLSCSVGGFILSHQAISLIGIFLLSLYTLFQYLQKRDNRIFLLRIFGIFFGISIAAFYWLPLLTEAKFTYLLSSSVSFEPISSFFYSPNRFGFLFQGNRGELYFPLGYFHLLVISFSVFIFLFPFIKKKFTKQEKNIYIICLTCFVISFFMMLSVSKPLWEVLPFIKGFQMSYRLSLFCAFFSSIIAGLVLPKFRKLIVFLILGLVIITTILNWGTRRVIPTITDSTISYQPALFPNNMGTGNTIWLKNLAILASRPKENLQVLDGSAVISEMSRSSTQHKYTLNVESKVATLKENTLYFPDWKLIVNNKYYPFSYTSASYSGLITFSLKKGFYKVEFSYHDTIIRLISRYISIFAFIFITFLTIFLSIKNSKKKTLN